MRAPAAASVVLALAACGGGDDGGLTVFAASSLREVFPQIDDAATYSFAGSDGLAAQIREGADADVFAAASPRPATALHREGLVETPETFALNRLVIVVPRANEAGIRTLGDLAAADVRLVLADEGVPAGDYARLALRLAGEERVLANVVSLEEEVKGVVAKVALGEADAGIAYATDVAPVADDVRAVELPEAVQPRVEYVVAVVSESGQRERAREFVRRLLSDGGRKALRGAGFALP